MQVYGKVVAVYSASEYAGAKRRVRVKFEMGTTSETGVFEDKDGEFALEDIVLCTITPQKGVKE